MHYFMLEIWDKLFILQRHVNKRLSRKVDRKHDGIIYCRGGLIQFVLLLVAAANIDGELQSLALCLHSSVM